jgi:hypothetical protein
MQPKSIIEIMKAQVDNIKECNSDMETASFNYQDGVILSGNEAEEIIKYFEKVEKPFRVVYQGVGIWGKEMYYKNFIEAEKVYKSINDDPCVVFQVLCANEQWIGIKV